MPVRKSPVKPSASDHEIPKVDNTLRAARGIRTIQNRALANTLKILPWVTLIVALVVLFPGNPTGAHGAQIFGTAVVTVAVVLFAFQVLLSRVPQTMEALWRRKLVLDKIAPSEVGESTRERGKDHDDHAAGYLNYLREFEALLNNRNWQVGMIIGFELLVNLWLGFLNLNFLNALIHGQIGLLSLVELVIDMTLAALIAPMAWRLIVIGLQIWRLPTKFDLKIQFEHPDQCGGLEPLGSLCLWNILIISLPLVFLGGWLLIARSDTSFFSFHDSDLWQHVLSQAHAYARVYTLLLWVLVPFTFVGFILPLWNTHLVMEEKRREMLARLDVHVENIAAEWNAAVDRIGSMSVGEGKEKLDQLEFARQIYQRQKRVPVWPINLSIFLKFASTQVVPLLSLTGLGPGILKIISFLINFLSPS